MSLPAPFNFKPAYQGDRVLPITLKMQYKSSGELMSLTGAMVRIHLVDTLGNIVWKFYSYEGGDTLLTIEDDKIKFPLIKSWDIPSGIYRYDTEIIFPDQSVQTFTVGTREIIERVTKPVLP